jgi:hypothetical protein
MRIAGGNQERWESSPAGSGPNDPRRIWAVACLLIVLGIVAAIRIRLLDFPLERDEGEFAYGGQLLLQGASPYDGAYTLGLKLPGTTAAYALIMAIFGQTTLAIHTGLVLVNLADALLLFVIARRIYGDAAGIVAAGTFALLSIIPATDGLAAHATHFVVLFALAGIALLQPLDERTSGKKIFGAGLLLGLAFLMKQTGALFCLFGAAWILWWEISSGQRRWPRLLKRMAWLAAGGTLPFLLTCLAIAAAGDSGLFWFWSFRYAAVYGSIINPHLGLAWMLASLRMQFESAPGLWLATLAGVPLLCCNRSLRHWRFFIVSLAVLSYLAVCPGWYFRGHYFIQLFPAAGLLAGAAFHGISGWWDRARVSSLPAPAVVFAAAGAAVLVQWSGVFFQLPPAQACRAVYGLNPFPEAVEISRYLETHTAPGAKIAVLGSEPEIFFYTHRRSATGHILTYPLVEPQPYAAAMRDQMIREIEQAQPEYVVYVNITYSWVHTTAPMDYSILQWFNQYRHNRYELTGLVNLFPDRPSEYQWGAVYQVITESVDAPWIAIFKRR